MATKTDLWSLVFGLWSLVFGLWSLVFGLWSLDRGANSCPNVCQHQTRLKDLRSKTKDLPLLHHAEHWGVARFEHLPVAYIHMHATRQTRIKTTYRPHDVDALEGVWSILFEEGRV